MGSKQALSNGRESEEAIDMISAFEQANSCIIIVTASLKLNRGFIDWNWTATATSTKRDEQEASVKDLGSVSVWAGDYKTLMGVVTRLLYALDFHLALQEFERVELKKA